MEMIKKFKAFCGRFAKQTKGNVAIIFGVMMVPTMVLTGGLVDYGMAIKTKSQLTSTLDAAMLAAMLQYSDDEDADYQKIIEDYIDQNFTSSNKKLHGTVIEVTAAAISDEGEMSASVKAVVPTSFLKFAHKDEFEFTISAAVMVGGSSIEVALVLDNTASMQGSKITDLKSAVKDLLDIIYPEDYDNSDEKIRFSVVPFADYVNIGVKVTGEYVVVGRSDRDEPGTDIPEDYKVNWNKDAYNKCWNTYPDSTRKCKPKPKKWGTCYNDGVPYPCKKWNGETCTGSYGDPVEKCEWQEAESGSKNYKWYGCMASRVHDLNTRDEEYGTGVPSMMKNYCKNDIATMTRLTPIRDAIISGIDDMKAKRNTYIPSGLVWGWRSLTSTAPFADGAPYTSAAVRKVIVLMTDGNNTKSMKKRTGDDTINNDSEVWGHKGSSSSQANNYTGELCANIKEKGIMVYTIGFEIDGGSDIENLMKACAGNGGQYYDADNSTELADAFKEIGKSLLNLRLTK